MTLTPPAHLAALLIAVLGLAALGAQVALSTALTGTLPAALWTMGRFFTILTNTLVVASFTLMALRGRALPAWWLAGLTLWIVIVGAVFHLLLAGLAAPTGLAWWTDQAFHSFVPVLVAAWWLAFAPKAALAWSLALAWLAWPLVYVAYALARGAMDGVYPYPFVDVSALGYGGVARNAVGLATGFFLGGLGLVGLARALTR